MAIEELGEGYKINFGRGPCLIQPREMVDTRGFAPPLPWIQQVTLAPGDETWVGQKEVGNASPGRLVVYRITR